MPSQKDETKKVAATAQTGGQTAAATAVANPQQNDNQNSNTTTKVAKTEVKFTEADKTLFQQQESLITSNQETFLVIGQALSVIKAKDLQKITDPNLDFSDYCNRRWGFGEKYAYKLIAAYECVSKLKAELTPKGVTVFPTCEAQVRPLTKLKPAEQLKLWASLVEDAESTTITAAAIEEAVANTTGTANSAGNSTATESTDDKAAKALAKAEHRKLIAIGKLIEKAKQIDPIEFSIKKFQDILDKIGALLNDTNDE